MSFVKKTNDKAEKQTSWIKIDLNAPSFHSERYRLGVIELLGNYIRSCTEVVNKGTVLLHCQWTDKSSQTLELIDSVSESTAYLLVHLLDW